MRRSFSAILTVAALALAVPASAAVVEENDGLPLFEEVVATYRALPAYTDMGEAVTRLEVDGRPFEQRTRAQISFVRPGRLRIECGELSWRSDGTTRTTVVPALRQYAQEAAPGAFRPEIFLDDPLVGPLLGAPLGPPQLLLVELLVGEKPTREIYPASTRFVLEADADLAGKARRRLRIETPDGPPLRLWIDPVTKWIARVEPVLDEKALAAIAPPGSTFDGSSFAWESGEIVPLPLPDPAFAFEPPQGYTRLATLAEGAPKPKAEADAKAEADPTLGKAAPEFTLTVLAGPDKVERLSKDDLAGKVVVIDFWATWCGPCRKELPELAKVIDGYEQAGTKDLVFVALSLDRQPADLEGVRKAVEAGLAEIGVKLDRPGLSRVGLDPTGGLGEAFAVEGIPTLIVLDREGIVRSRQVGFDPDADFPAKLKATIDPLLAPSSP